MSFALSPCSPMATPETRGRSVAEHHLSSAGRRLRRILGGPLNVHHSNYVRHVGLVLAVTKATNINKVLSSFSASRDGCSSRLASPVLRSRADYEPLASATKPIAPGSPWQNAYAEKLIGTIRRECLNHMIVFGEAHLRQKSWASMPPIISHEFIARSTKMTRSIGRLSAGAVTSSGRSRRRPCCHRPIRRRCCSGRCSCPVRSIYSQGWWLADPRPQNPSINRLTSPPDSLTSKCRRSRHTISNTIRDGTQSVCENTQSVQLGDHRE